MLPPTPSSQSQERPGLFGRIGNFFGADDPNAGTATDPFANLSRSQRTMLGFAALRDAAASLEGRDSSYFNEALGSFEQARERERLRAQGEFANRNEALFQLAQLEFLANQPGAEGLRPLIEAQRQVLLGSGALGDMAAPAAGGGAMPLPTPVDFTGGTLPTDPPSGPQGVTGPPPTGVVYDDAGTVTPAPYTGEAEPVAPPVAPLADTVAPVTPTAPAATPASPFQQDIAEIDAEIERLRADQQNALDRLGGAEVGAGMGIPTSPGSIEGEIQSIQGQINELIGRRETLDQRLYQEQQAAAEAQPALEAARLANEDAARQAAYNRSIIRRVMEDPSLSGVVGRIEGQAQPGTLRGQVLFDEDELNLLAQIDQLGSQVFLEAREMLQGGGQITDFEGQRAETAISRIGQRGVSVEAYQQALRELDQIFANAEARALGQEVPFPEIDTDPNAGGGAAPTASTATGGATHRYNPETGQIEAIR